MDIQLFSYGKVSKTPFRFCELEGPHRPDIVTICWLKSSVQSPANRYSNALMQESRLANYYIDIGYKIRMKPGRIYVIRNFNEIISDENRLEDIYYLHLYLWPCPTNGLIEIDISHIKRCLVLVNALTSLINEPKEIIMPLVSSLFSCAEICESFNSYTNGSILKVINYIQHNFSMQLNNTDLAAIAGYNTNYFIRIFKQETGSSPYEYIQNVRLSNAMNMLSNGTSIKETAMACGFSNQKVFCRAFKKQFGKAPSNYSIT